MNTTMPVSDIQSPAPAGAMPMGMLPTLHARRDAGRAAITFDGLTVSRGQLEANANRRAVALAQMGVKADDFVTLALPNSIEFYESAFAIWKLGATPNPVSSRLPRAELDAIVDLVKPKVVIGVDADRLPGFRTLPVGWKIDETLSPEAHEPKIARYWKAMTSGGSTGRPKVIVDHQESSWDPAAVANGLKPDGTVLNAGPLYHNAGFTCSMIGLFTGSHVVEMGKFEPLRALELIERHKVTWVNFVPTMMHRIWRLPQAERLGFDLSSLDVVYHMASACPIWLKEQWIEWLGPERIFELYGGTERTGYVVISGDEWLKHKGSVGKIQPGASLKIVNDHGDECGAGEVGEIFLLPDNGENSTYHYIGAEAKSLSGWQSLGDLGYKDDDGYLYLVDRRTDLIISGGVNIYPAEVEAALDAHPAVSSSIVIGLPDDDLGHKVHALVQIDSSVGRSVSDDELRTFLAESLLRYKIPRSFEFVDEPLRDDAGKARRSALRDARMNLAEAERG